MQILEPLELKPLFYSEINSSFILYDFLKRNNNCIDFLNYLKDNDLIMCDLTGYSEVYIEREYSYKGKGSIDIFISLRSQDGKCKIFLIEVKVHDYLSAKPNQISTYLEAARESEGHDDITFIYLTQFNEKYLKNYPDTLPSGTIIEFETAISLYPQRVFHITWDDFCNFLESDYSYKLTATQKIMLDLHKTWMLAQMKEDIKKYQKNSNKDRAFSYYFPSSDDKTSELINLGKEINKGNAVVLSINLYGKK